MDSYTFISSVLNSQKCWLHQIFCSPLFVLALFIGLTVQRSHLSVSPAGPNIPVEPIRCCRSISIAIMIIYLLHNLSNQHGWWTVKWEFDFYDIKVQIYRNVIHFRHSIIEDRYKLENNRERRIVLIFSAERYCCSRLHHFSGFGLERPGVGPRHLNTVILSVLDALEFAFFDSSTKVHVTVNVHKKCTYI